MRRLAAANIALHLVGLVCAALWMRPGTPAAGLTDRMDYLAGQPAGWALGWAVWIGCIALMVAFTAAAARRLGEPPLARLAVVVAAVGGAFDLLGDSTYIIVFPQVAALQPRNMQLFLIVERFTAVISLVVANGLYTVATLLLTLAGRGRLSRLTALCGYGVLIFGLLLSAAAFTGSAFHVEAATGPTIGLYAAWVWLAARDLEAA